MRINKYAYIAEAVMDEIKIILIDSIAWPKDDPRRLPTMFRTHQLSKAYELLTGKKSTGCRCKKCKAINYEFEETMKNLGFYLPDK